MSGYNMIRRSLLYRRKKKTEKSNDKKKYENMTKKPKNISIELRYNTRAHFSSN